MTKKNKKQKKQAQPQVDAKLQEADRILQQAKSVAKVASSIKSKAQGSPDGARSLALALAIPGAGSGVRLPTEDGPRTSVMCCRDQFTVTNVQYNYSDFALGDQLFMFYGQPGRVLMYYTVVPTSVYNLNFVNRNASTYLTAYTNYWNVSPAAVPTTVADSNFWTFAGATPNDTAVAPHGTWLPSGLSDDVPYIHMNGSDRIEISHNNPWTGAAVGVLAFNVWVWNGPGSPPVKVNTVSVSITASNFTTGTLFSAGIAGYYALSFEGFVINSGSITSTNNSVRLALITSGTGATGGWVNRTMQDMDSTNFGDAAVGQQCRVNAASLLITNTSSVLNRQGTVLAARIKLDNPFQLTISALRRSAERYAGDAASGCYTFKEFSKEAENFVDAVGPGGALVFDLDYVGYTHVVMMTCPGVATSPNTYTVSADTVVEFKTDVARYQKAVSPYRYVDLVEARKIVNSNPAWFYENPMHMTQIYGFVKNMAKKFMQGVNTVAPYAATIAGMAQPDKAAAYQALAAAVRGIS